jgi:hypothetical protein
VVRISVLRRIGDFPVGPQYGEIGQPVDSDHPGPCRRAVRKLRRRLLTAADHVRVRQQMAVCGQYYA